MNDSLLDYYKTLSQSDMLLLIIQKVDEHNGQIREMAKALKENTDVVRIVPVKNMERIEKMECWIEKYEKKKDNLSEFKEKKIFEFRQTVIIALCSAIFVGIVTYFVTKLLAC